MDQSGAKGAAAEAWSDHKGAVNRSTASTSPADSNSGRGSPADRLGRELASRAGDTAAASMKFASQVMAEMSAGAQGPFGPPSGNPAGIIFSDDEEEEQRGAEFEVARASSLSPARETFRDAEWSGGEDDSEEMFGDSNDGGMLGARSPGYIGRGHRDDVEFDDIDMQFADNSTAGADSAAPGGVRSNDYDSDDPDASFDLLAHLPSVPGDDSPFADDSAAVDCDLADGVDGPGMEDNHMTSPEVQQGEADRSASILPPSSSAPEKLTFSMGTSGAGDASQARSPRSRSGSRSPCRNLVRDGGFQRGFSAGGGGVERHNSPKAIPKRRANATPKMLRRSPRVAANAAAAAVAGAEAGDSSAGVANILESSLLRSAKKRQGPGPGAAGSSSTSIVTPYSTRRARRASAVFQPFTPGAESSGGGEAGMDSSFCTAIMGEVTPGNKSILESDGNDSVVRRGGLFDKKPADEQNSLVDSEPTPTLPASLEAARYPSRTRTDDSITNQNNDGIGAPPAAEDEVSALQARMATLSCAEDGEGDTQGGGTAAKPTGIVTDFATSENAAEKLADVLGIDGIDDDPHVESLPQVQAMESADDSQVFAPPSPAVGFPSAGEPPFSPPKNVESANEISPDPYTSQNAAGGFKTMSTFGMSSCDEGEAGTMAEAFAGDEHTINLTLPEAREAMEATSPQVANVADAQLTRSPDEAAGVSDGLKQGGSGSAMQGATREIFGEDEAKVPMAKVEKEARSLAVALVQEEESRNESMLVDQDETLTTLQPTAAIPVAPRNVREPESTAGGSGGRSGLPNAPPKVAQSIEDKAGLDRSNGSIRSQGSTRANGSLGSVKVNRVARPASPSRATIKSNRPTPAGSTKNVSANTSTMAGAISTMSARHGAAKSGGVERGRRMSSSSGPVVARRQSMAFGSPVRPMNAASATGTNAGTTRASSSRRASVAGRGSVAGGNGRPQGERDAAASSFGAAGSTSAAPVPAVAANSHLLAPTASSQSRARPRSASPSVTAARGRSASTGGGHGPPMSSGTAAGGQRRVSSGQPMQPQQQAQQRLRANSTGRRALTTPKTPNFRSSNRMKTEKDMETTEQAEVRKQREMQEHVKQMTRRNKLAMERSRRSAYSGNVRSSKPLTVPESPAMKTVGRLGGKVYAAVGSQVDQAGFSPTHPAKDDPLTRDHAAAPAAAQPREPTVPHPFHLSQSNRTVREGSGSGDAGSLGNGMTFRETMSRLENKTPERYRTKPAGDKPKSTVAASTEPPKPTLPMSPRFRTEARAAGHSKSRVMSREEREDAELAEMKKHQFKARPFRADGFGVGGEKGVFRPQHSDKQLTQPAPFRLSTEGRAANRAPSPHRSRDEEELSKQFKARPMPGGRSSSVGRVRPGANVGQGAPDLRGRQSLTVAASPMLTTKRRSAVRSSSMGGPPPTSEQAELDSAAAKQFKARPMPDYSRLASQGLNRRQSMGGDQSIVLTEPRPFNLLSEERGKVKQALLAQRLEEKRRQEEAAQRVRARPLPPATMGFVPAPCERPLTETSEFALSGQARHERAAQQFRERVRREEERARRATKVKALPLPAATFEPEQYPARSEITLTEPLEVMLHSTARAEGRAQWEVENQARLEAEERRRLEEAEAVAAAESAAIAEIRRRPQEQGGMSFKAKPIQWNSSAPHSAPLSTAPLTTPITPNLRTKRRAINAVNREQHAPLA